MTCSERYAAAIARHRSLAEDMLRQAHLVTPDPDEQAGALLIAATVLIERQVGRALAPAALAAVLEPTIVSWAEQQAGEMVQ